MAGAAEAQEQPALLLVEVYDLDVTAVGGDVGAERIQRALNAFDRVHKGRGNSYSRIRQYKTRRSRIKPARCR